MDENFTYPQNILEFLVRKTPDECIEVFRVIVRNATSGGTTWKELNDYFNNRRHTIEKALLLLETMGFILVAPDRVSGDRREKPYMPHNIRGRQLAEYLANKKQRR